LHTAILARLLERPAFLYAGPSRRMRAVYEYSLAPMDGVTLMD
jgi:hypothetical protein